MAGTPQWYMAIGGHQVGPVSQEEIVANIQNGSVDSKTLVYGPGMTSWTPINDVATFAPSLGQVGGAAPPVPAPPGRRAHEIDFNILGNEMQFVEVELDPGESAVAEAGAMMYMNQG